MSHLIAPSLLASDFANLQSECEMINKSDADWYHLDVMDGVFVPNISFGIPIIKYINKHTLKPLDVHLMIVEPERYIKDFKKVGANILTVHIEASINPGFGGQAFIEGTYRKVEKLKSMIVKAGLDTKIEIDGGVTSANARKLIDCGADVLVAGSFVFKSEDPTKTIAELKKI